MAQFTVTPEMLTTTAGNIRNIDSRFNQIMSEIESEMTTMKSRWESEAASGFITKFQGLKDNFQNYSQVIKSYSTFLDKAAESYRTSEKNINNATSNLFS